MVYTLKNSCNHYSIFFLNRQCAISMHYRRPNIFLKVTRININVIFRNGIFSWYLAELSLIDPACLGYCGDVFLPGDVMCSFLVKLCVPGDVMCSL